MSTSMLFLLATFFLISAADAQDRKALVVGNDGDPKTPAVSLAAHAVSKALEADGFEVQEAINLQTTAEVESATTQFVNSIHAGDVALLFYAGPNSPADTELPRLEDRITATGASLKILLLATDGLAAVEPRPDTWIITANSPGRAPMDPQAGTVSFAWALIHAMRDPVLGIAEVFEHVRLEVEKGSHGQQIPWVAQGALRSFHFALAGIAGDHPGPLSPPTKPLGIGGSVMAANLIYKVAPKYPSGARSAHVEGIVLFQGIIGRDGHILNLTLVSGDPLLADAAREAVSQWLYKPTLFNGEPVEVITTISVNFRLQHAAPKP